MPSIKVVPPGDQSRQGYEQIQAGFGPGAPGALQIVAPASASRRGRGRAAGRPGHRRGRLPPQPGGGGQALIEAVPTSDPSSPRLGATIDRLRAELPAGALIGGPAAENHDLEAALAAKTPLVIGVVLALGFLLLLVAFQAPLVAAIGVLTNLLSTGAAFGVAKLIFQDGHLAGLLGFESQGFLDAWAPVFFFAMIFAISMDYTVFLLSSASEHWDATGDAHEAMVGGLAHSGRVILAAGAVMVAVFFTFALSGPLPPKEMGVILGIAVLLDAFLVRLLLLPVLLRLAGPAAWYLPQLARPHPAGRPLRPRRGDARTESSPAGGQAGPRVEGAARGIRPAPPLIWYADRAESCTDLQMPERWRRCSSVSASSTSSKRSAPASPTARVAAADRGTGRDREDEAPRRGDRARDGTRRSGAGGSRGAAGARNAVRGCAPALGAAGRAGRRGRAVAPAVGQRRVVADRVRARGAGEPAKPRSTASPRSMASTGCSRTSVTPSRCMS